jgi:hypothetical protein
LSQAPVRTMQAARKYEFPDLGTQLATAQAFVRGVVAEEIHGPKDKHGLSDRTLNFEVSEVLYGDSPKNLELRDGSHFASDGKTLMIVDGLPEMRKGDELVVFLMQGDSPDEWGVISEAGAFDVENGKLATPSELTLSAEVEGQQISEFKTVIGRLGEDVRAGKLRALPLPGAEMEAIRGSLASPEELLSIESSIGPVVLLVSYGDDGFCYAVVRSSEHKVQPDDLPFCNPYAVVAGLLGEGEVLSHTVSVAGAEGETAVFSIGMGSAAVKDVAVSDEGKTETVDTTATASPLGDVSYFIEEVSNPNATAMEGPK